MATKYDPSNQFEIKVRDIEFRQTPTRMLLARIYQPQGEGPFPTLLDLHGAAGLNDIDLIDMTMRRCVEVAGATVAVSVGGMDVSVG